jgi:hypothetical protein
MQRNVGALLTARDGAPAYGGVAAATADGVGKIADCEIGAILARGIGLPADGGVGAVLTGSNRQAADGEIATAIAAGRGLQPQGGIARTHATGVGTLSAGSIRRIYAVVSGRVGPRAAIAALDRVDLECGAEKEHGGQHRHSGAGAPGTDWLHFGGHGWIPPFAVSVADARSQH